MDPCPSTVSKEELVEKKLSGKASTVSKAHPATRAPSPEGTPAERLAWDLGAGRQGCVKADTPPVAGPSGRQTPRETCSPHPDVTPGRAQGTSGLRPGPGSPAPSSGPGRHVKATEGDLEWSSQSLPGSAAETSLCVSEPGG